MEAALAFHEADAEVATLQEDLRLRRNDVDEADAETQRIRNLIENEGC